MEIMLARRIILLLGIALLLLAAELARAQIVRVDFTSEVTNVLGELLPGVGVGTIITGRVEVDLAHLPLDSESGTEGSYRYGPGDPGYTFAFSTGTSNYVYYSTNAGRGFGAWPGTFLHDGSFGRDYLAFQARNEGNLNAALLTFEDPVQPSALVNYDYFPESVNLEPGLPRAAFNFHGGGPNFVFARVTSAAMSIDTGGSVTALLLYRVNVSVAQAKTKRKLTRMLNAAERAFAHDRCRLGVVRLRHFNTQVHVRLRKQSPVLAGFLRAGAQEIINSGCAR